MVLIMPPTRDHLDGVDKNPGDGLHRLSDPFGEPGRLTTRVLPRIPAIPRERYARSVCFPPSARISSPMPGISLSQTPVVASGGYIVWPGSGASGGDELLNYRESVIERILKLNSRLWRDKNREGKSNVTKTSESEEKNGTKPATDK